MREIALAVKHTRAGSGIGKAERGDGLDVMRAIKAALDPLDIMNPGKIFPA